MNLGQVKAVNLVETKGQCQSTPIQLILDECLFGMVSMCGLRGRLFARETCIEICVLVGSTLRFILL